MEEKSVPKTLSFSENAYMKYRVLAGNFCSGRLEIGSNDIGLSLLLTGDGTGHSFCPFDSVF